MLLRVLSRLRQPEESTSTTDEDVGWESEGGVPDLIRNLTEGRSTVAEFDFRNDKKPGGVTKSLANQT